MMRHVSVHAVIDAGIAAGWLPADSHDRARTALAQAAREDTPWYLRVLIGGAAWFAALFLLGTVLGLLALALGDRVDVAAILLGLGMMPGGVLLRAGSRHELARQSALVVVICGQLLLVGGLGAMRESTTLVLGALAATCVVLIVLFDDAVYRFAGTLTVIGAGLGLAFEWQVPYALGIATATTACVPLIAWRVPALQTIHRIVDPIAWASAVGVCGLLTTQTIVDAVTGPVGQSAPLLRLLMPTPWPLAGLFVALQVWLALQVAHDHDSAPTEPAPAAAIVAIVVIGVLTLSTPAISGALLLMVLAFDRRRTGLLGLAAAFLVAFLGLYYYSLALTLLQKSGILIATGAVCLTTAAFFHAQAKKVAA